MVEEDSIELHFFLPHFIRIGPAKFDMHTSLATIKNLLFERWPRDKTIGPESVDDIRLFYAGKLLRDPNKTLAELRSILIEGVNTIRVTLFPAGQGHPDVPEAKRRRIQRQEEDEDLETGMEDLDGMEV